MRKLTGVCAAICAVAVAFVAPGLQPPAQAQMSALVELPSDAASAAVADGSVPGWYRRVGEGAFTLREPSRGVYFILGGHAGFGESTRLDDEADCAHPQAFFLGCENARPSDSLGTGGGGSIGIGTRITPAVRVALLFTGETGYHFHNDRPWVSAGSGETFIEKFSIHSYQGTGNIYLDVAGLLPPGALGGFNPYVMGGLGMAVNVTGDTKEFMTFGSNGTATNTYPGATRESFLWTVGAGLQYRVAPGVIADVSYQYVDAGRFRAASGNPQIDGTSGQPFDPPFRAIRGDLATHRVGFAVNVELEAISRWFSRRP
jgi:opacity protein-like surface antigen